MDIKIIIRKNGTNELYRQHQPHDGRKVLKQNSLNPHLVEEWCISKDQSTDFVACMEDVRKVYSRPYDKCFPVVCMDEKPLQLWEKLVRDEAIAMVH